MPFVIFHEKDCQEVDVATLWFPDCLAFIRTLFEGCRCPVHVSVRVRRCYLRDEFLVGSIGIASDPEHEPQSPDTTWETY